MLPKFLILAESSYSSVHSRILYPYSYYIAFPLGQVLVGTPSTAFVSAPVPRSSRSLVDHKRFTEALH